MNSELALFIILYILMPRKGIKYVFEFFQFRITASIQCRTKNDIRIRLRGFIKILYIFIHFNFEKGNQRIISNEMQRLKKRSRRLVSQTTLLTTSPRNCFCSFYPFHFTTFFHPLLSHHALPNYLFVMVLNDVIFP